MYVVFCKSKLIVVGVYKQHSKAILSALDNGNALVLKCNNKCKIKDLFIQLLRFYLFSKLPAVKKTYATRLRQKEYT